MRFLWGGRRDEMRNGGRLGIGDPAQHHLGGKKLDKC
jgi:hypothetical protein